MKSKHNTNTNIIYINLFCNPLEIREKFSQPRQNFFLYFTSYSLKIFLIFNLFLRGRNCSPEYILTNHINSEKRVVTRSTATPFRFAGIQRSVQEIKGERQPEKVPITENIPCIFGNGQHQKRSTAENFRCGRQSSA